MQIVKKVKHRLLTGSTWYRMTKNISRRRFLKLAAGSAAVLAVGGVAYYYATKNQSKLATQTIGGTTNISAFPVGVIVLFPIIAEQTCTVTAVGVNTAGSDGPDSGNGVQTGVYTDSRGVPGTLLGHSNSKNLVTGATWYDPPLISPVSFVKGTQYWLGTVSNDVSGDGTIGMVNYYSTPSPGIHYDLNNGGYNNWPVTAAWNAPSVNILANMRINYTTPVK